MSLRASSSVPNTPSTVAVQACLPRAHLLTNSVRTALFAKERFKAIGHPASSEVVTFAGTSKSVRPGHTRSLPEAEDVESLMHEIRLACFVLCRRFSETVLDLGKMFLGWLRKLLEQERALRGRHAVPKLEASGLIEIDDKDK